MTTALIVTTAIVAECTSITVLIARWARQYAAHKYQHDAPEAFIGHLVAGLVPIVGLGILIGNWLHRQELAAKAKQEELASAEADIVRLLKGEP